MGLAAKRAAYFSDSREKALDGLLHARDRAHVSASRTVSTEIGAVLSPRWARRITFAGSVPLLLLTADGRLHTAEDR